MYVCIYIYIYIYIYTDSGRHRRRRESELPIEVQVPETPEAERRGDATTVFLLATPETSTGSLDES